MLDKLSLPLAFRITYLYNALKTFISESCSLSNADPQLGKMKHKHVKTDCKDHLYCQTGPDTNIN